MKNSLMRKYKPQMILLLVIVIEAVILIGLVEYRSYVVRKQEQQSIEQQESIAQTTPAEETTAEGEELTTLAHDQIKKRTDTSSTANETDGKRIICLDAALGGYVKGNTSKTEAALSESEYNLEFATLIKDALNQQGVLVYMTRESSGSEDEEDDTWRTDLANNVYADAMITLTRDTYDGKDKTSGITVWVHHKRPKVSNALADGILNALEKQGAAIHQVDAGTAKSQSEDYYTNKDCIGSSLVLGMGSVLNESDISDYEANKEAYATAVAQAIVSWMDEQGL